MNSNHFWAKTKLDKTPGKSVLSHMTDVREAARLLLLQQKSLLEKYECDIDQLAALAGLHDIGKIAPGFQMKCSQWLKDSGFGKEARIHRWDAIHESDHARITQYVLQAHLSRVGVDSTAAGCWAAIAGAHHGRLYQPGLRCPDGIANGDEWDKWRNESISTFLSGSTLPSLSIDDSWKLFWWTAGLISVADWIGSNEDFFPADIETKPSESIKIAEKALKAVGLGNLDIKQGLSFKDIFQFSPNDLQQKAVEHIKEPGLYVIEAPMGIGKTEAALWCSYQLMQKGLAAGIYFALPTQATSNRIHRRINDFATKITNSVTKTRLVHAGSWLLDEVNVPLLRPVVDSEKESMRDAVDWFASKKRALLAPLGVGTVDQALMSVIAVKHFFVRQFALAGKVVILDEVHSYDLYTGTLIKTLCDRLLPLGCTILVLSATLTNDRRKQFLNEQSGQDKDNPYPLVSGKDFAVSINPPKPKTIAVIHKNKQEALTGALEVRKGACILWICNTVNSAQEMFKLAHQQDVSGVELGLLHSRFPVFRRQELEDCWMEKLGKEEKSRSGCILFSTQIIEQSVDLDADLIISELAPTDMLLQRLGRLWRHERINRPLAKPELWFIAETHTLDEFKKASARDIRKMFGSKAFVYAPYVLLRSLEVWSDLSSLTLPENIRGLLEGTYSDRTDDSRGWQSLHGEIQGEEFAKKNAANFETNVWQHLLADEEGMAKTRINDILMTQLVLARSQEGRKVVLMNGDEVVFNNDKFELALARKIHKNIVKVPAYYFEGQTDNKSMAAQVRGGWQFGIAQSDGSIQSSNLKSGYQLRYTTELGTEIIRDQQNREVNDEPSE